MARLAGRKYTEPMDADPVPLDTNVLVTATLPRRANHLAALRTCEVQHGLSTAGTGLGRLEFPDMT